MKPSEILEEFREEAHDRKAEPYLWENRFLLRALNEARMQAARRGRLLFDTTTDEICKIALKAGTSVYSVDPRVIYIRRVKIVSQVKPLPKISVADLDLTRPGWEDEPVGEPCVWVPIEDHKIRIFNTPEAAGVLRLHVVREPLADVTIESSEEDMELEPRYHYRIKDFMCGRAYMQRDLIEKYRPEEARDKFALFDEEFGPAESAVNEKWIHRKHGYDEFEGLE